MRRMILATFVFIYFLSWAEVRVEKVLETTSIKEYNQWVKKNKTKYPRLKPIYIQHEMTKIGKSSTAVDYEPERTFDPPSTNPFINEYNVRYYDEDGDIVKEEIIRGYVAVQVSLDFDEILINKRDHPWYPEKRISIVKDNRGNIKFTKDTIFSLRFTGAELYIEKADIEIGATSLRLFDKNGSVIGNLEGASSPFDDYLPVANADKKFFVEGYRQEPDYRPGLLFLYTQKGEVLWCKEFPWQEKAPWGLHPSISGDGQVIAIGHVNKVYVYHLNGELWREYKYEYPHPAITALSYDGRFLAIATREGGTKVMLCDNKNGKMVWNKKIEGLVLSTKSRCIAMSPNGRYIALMLRPDQVYLLDEKGQILKQWDLHGIVGHAVAPSGKRVEIPLGVFTILQFIDNLLIIKYTKDNPDFKTDFNYIIEKVMEDE